MNTIIEHLMGMSTMTDQVITMDMLVTAKSGVRNYAMAITEVQDPEIKGALAKQLDDAIDSHERIVSFAMTRGWYQPWNVEEQLKLDLKNIQTSLKLANIGD